MNLFYSIFNPKYSKPQFYAFSLALLLAFSACNKSGDKEIDGYPAAPQFDAKGSDKKAIEIADRMMEKLGGFEPWYKAKYVAFSFFGQYQIWDKQNGILRHEKGNTVSLVNLNKFDGRIFVNGQEITDSTRRNDLLMQAYTHWYTNNYFLFMPYKLKENGVTLKYRGEGKTFDGHDSDILRLTFNGAGYNPENMHDLWIDKKTNLPAQWGFYGNQQETTPSFIRKWADYKDFNGLKLAVNRDSPDDTLRINHVVVTDFVSKELFLSTTPIDKSKIK